MEIDLAGTINIETLRRIALEKISLLSDEDCADIMKIALILWVC